MPTQIAILGLNRLTLSLGLALGARGLAPEGFDPDMEQARQAQQLGAVAHIHWNMGQAVRAAELIVLALPLSKQAEVLTALASDLSADKLVVCLSPLLAPPLAWAAQALSKEANFVAWHPLLNPTQVPVLTAAPDARLFALSRWALAPAPTGNPEKLQRVTQLAGLVGAQPYFVDPAEHDGLVGCTHTLPVLLAWGLMQTASTSPGWEEMRKTAAREFATATTAILEAEPETVLLDRDGAVHYLDAALAALNSLREKIKAGDAVVLANTFAMAASRRAEWLAECQLSPAPPAEAGPAVPTLGVRLRRLFLGTLLERRP